jgi:membrane associated rhomboid family serine protease
VLEEGVKIIMLSISRQYFAGVKFSIFIAILTAIYSSSVAYMDSGSLIGVVKVKDLHDYGGIRVEDIFKLEVWRVITAQLVHVKPPHMMLNVIFLVLTGAFLERNLGSFQTAGIWLVGGGLGTVLSTIGIKPPWDVGTGASHATFAMASAALIVCLGRNVSLRSVGLALAALIVGSGLILDFTYGGYPKLGHVISFALGALIAWYGRHR